MRGALVGGVAALLLIGVGCGGGDNEPPAGAVHKSGSACAGLAANVQNYNTLVGSRAEYLTLLHKLQRDCPGVAAKLGLTGVGLLCESLAQENCTMYEGRP
jgi:hypothetical protein